MMTAITALVAGVLPTLLTSVLPGLCVGLGLNGVRSTGHPVTGLALRVAGEVINRFGTSPDETSAAAETIDDRPEAQSPVRRKRPAVKKAPKRTPRKR